MERLREASDKDLVCDSEKDIQGHRMSLSGENTMASGQSLCQRQPENVLKLHSNKCEQISEGGLSEPVHSAWHALKQALWTLSVKSHTEI